MYASHCPNVTLLPIMPNIVRIDISHTGITDLIPLLQMKRKLRFLGIAGLQQKKAKGGGQTQQQQQQQPHEVANAEKDAQSLTGGGGFSFGRNSNGSITNATAASTSPSSPAGVGASSLTATSSFVLDPTADGFARALPKKRGGGGATAAKATTTKSSAELPPTSGEAAVDAGAATVVLVRSDGRQQRRTDSGPPSVACRIPKRLQPQDRSKTVDRRLSMRELAAFLPPHPIGATRTAVVSSSTNNNLQSSNTTAVAGNPNAVTRSASGAAQPRDTAHLPPSIGGDNTATPACIVVGSPSSLAAADSSQQPHSLTAETPFDPLAALSSAGSVAAASPRDVAVVGSAAATTYVYSVSPATKEATEAAINNMGLFERLQFRRLQHHLRRARPAMPKDEAVLMTLEVTTGQHDNAVQRLREAAFAAEEARRAAGRRALRRAHRLRFGGSGGAEDLTDETAAGRELDTTLVAVASGASHQSAVGGNPNTATARSVSGCSHSSSSSSSSASSDSPTAANGACGGGGLFSGTLCHTSAGAKKRRRQKSAEEKAPQTNVAKEALPPRRPLTRAQLAELALAADFGHHLGSRATFEENFPVLEAVLVANSGFEGNVRANPRAQRVAEDIYGMDAWCTVM